MNIFFHRTIDVNLKINLNDQCSPQSLNLIQMMKPKFKSVLTQKLRNQLKRVVYLPV